MSLKKASLFIFLLLLLVAPFVQSNTNEDAATTYSMNVLPSFVPPITSALRWICFIFSICIVLVNIKLFFKTFSVYYLMTLFYFVQLLYSLVGFTEVDRYFSLTLFLTTIPFMVFYTMLYNTNVIRYASYIIWFQVFFSLSLNYGMILSGQRFTGFSNNSNLYAITAIFWLVVLLINKKSRLNTIFIVLTIFSIFLSGSRNGLVGLILILLLQFRNNAKVLIFGGITLVALLLILENLIDLSFITERFLNIGNSAKDSGRDEFWDPAIQYIKSEPFWGYGMNANMTLIGTGNMHNVFLRYLLNMGLVFTILSFTFYFSFLLKSIIKFKILPGAILGFLIAFTLNNLGEDFLVGIGSSIFIYFVFIIGLLTVSLKHKL